MARARRHVPVGAMRLFALASCYATGTLAAERLAVSAEVALGVGACGAVLALGTRARTALLVAAACLGLALAGLRLAHLEGSALGAGALRGATAVLDGEALTDGRTRLGATRFVLAVRTASLDGEAVGVRERAWVTVRPPPEEPIEVGLRLRAEGRLAPVELPDMDAEGRASARRLRHRGVAARAFVAPQALTVLGRSSHPLVRVADRGREALLRAASHLSPRREALLRGVTIGDVSAMPRDVQHDFRVTGLSHIVAVSGTHVAIVLAVVALALRGLRAGRTATVLAMLATALAFMAITRFGASVMRAGAMAAIVLTGWAIGARRAAAQSLAAAVLVLLVIDPFLIHSAAFQLSALATLGILVIGPRVRAALPEGKLAALAAITIGAQLAVAPVILAHFHRLSLVTLAANLLVAPALAPAMIVGVAAAALGAAHEPLARLSVLADPFLGWMLWVTGSLAQLPLASVATPSGTAGLIVALGFLAATVALVRGRRPKRLAPVVLALCMVAAGGVWTRALAPQPPLAGLVIDMIDVGQGEAILVRAADAVMLIDGGPDPDGLFGALRDRGIGRIDLLVLTHPHEDHVAGLVPVVEHLSVGRVLDPMIPAGLASYGEFLAAVEHNRIPADRARAGDTYTLGPARVDVLWPPEEHVAGTGSDTNNNSIVLRVTYGTDRVLLAGETEEAAQQALLDGGEDLRARVLKVSHHGSARMVASFYQATGAELALIPVGRNTYGHPAPQTLIALRGMRVLRSDLSGDIAVALDGAGGVVVREQREAAGGTEPVAA